MSEQRAIYHTSSPSPETVELRLIGSPAQVSATVAWLQSRGLKIERDREWPSRKTEGAVCRYLEVVVPGSRPHTTRRKTAEDYGALAERRGFEWLGPLPQNTQTKTGWRCAQGHAWQAHYNSLSKGSGCPDCQQRRPKTAKDYQALAERRGFAWLGPLPRNILETTGWRCPAGHTWQAAYNTIQQGHGCRTCFHRRQG